jgi:hypothetical protein
LLVMTGHLAGRSRNDAADDAINPRDGSRRRIENV